MDNDLVFQIALTKVKSIGDFHAKTLISHYKTAKEIFNAPKSQLEKIEGIGSIRANNIKKFNQYNDCESEIKFIERHKITPLFYTKESYPNRLRNCIDSPILLYYKGVSDLNCKKIISIVGTRNNSSYGKEICEQIIDNLKSYDITVVSGLAYGIDTIAHKAALKNKLSTISVLAHGLDRIYPPANRDIAKEIIECGGLLTEFASGTNPDKQNFPSRNRITAGLCDALIVIESGAKGGSLITADIANSYNRDVFAIPGRVNDSKSEGCNILIQQNKAALISGAKDIIDYLQWEEIKKTNSNSQLELFTELTLSEKVIMGTLNDYEEIHIDVLNWKLKMAFSELSSALLTLEMNGFVKALPGKVYRKS